MTWRIKAELEPDEWRTKHRSQHSMPLPDTRDYDVGYKIGEWEYDGITFTIWTVGQNEDNKYWERATYLGLPLGVEDDSE